MALVVAVVFAIAAAVTPTVEAEPRTKALEQPVVVAPIRGTIDAGVEGFVKRAVRKAERAGAAKLVLELNTPGGRLGSALAIGETIRASKVETVAYVRGRAASAGTYIALNAHRIAMERGSTIGAAALVNMAGEPVTDAKLVSHWLVEMRAAAELRGRNPAIAEGMAAKSKSVHLPEIGKTFGPDEIVSLTADEALKVGYADLQAANLDELLGQLQLAGAERIDLNLSLAEKAARFLTHPAVMTLLFILGIAGVAIEMLVPGFGVPGIVGIVGFALYFFGQYAAGAAETERLLLFLLGIVLLAAELFVPSFGILGVAGIGSLLGGVLLAAKNPRTALAALGIGLIAAIVIVVLFVWAFRHRGIWNKFILRDRLTADQGYIASEEKSGLIGKTGVAPTDLHPAGIAVIDREQTDVVANGRFIAKDRPIVVVRTDGTRVVVREYAERL